MKQDKALMQARLVYYQLFSRFFIYQEDSKLYEELISILKILSENPLDNNSKEAIDRLLEKLDHSSNLKLIEEFTNIFYSPETKNIRTTASFYDEGFESGKKRLEMKRFLAKTKIRRNEASFVEHEDSFPFIVTVLAELNQLVVNGEDQYTHIQHCIFEQILNNFIDEFAKNIYEHDSADIYKDVIVILKAFTFFERLYLDVSKPKSTSIDKSKESKDEDITDEERERRERNKRLRIEDDNSSSCSIDTVYDVEDNVE